jgi:mitogen-activated protein kinase kinase
MSGDSQPDAKVGGTMMDKYSDFLDAKTGTLKFKGKAILSAQGVEFASGGTFKISLDEVDTLDELGKGNYGTVYKVRHARPRIRRPGLGLAGNRGSGFGSGLVGHACPKNGDSPDDHIPSSTSSAPKVDGTSGAVMAMKEIRLELDDAKFAAIIMELDVLHRCLSPYIIDFYGAFFQEGAVYICMEFMDGGSLDKLYGDGIPEKILRKITYSTTMGLKCLKEDHNIIHRDVKPTNILMNTRGQIKICDFGVSGNLVASIAKTNIGCQSYMAPERISSGGIAMAGNPGGTYSVQSDIWSLGLTIIECAMGRYPYPPETYNNIFSQLSVCSSDFYSSTNMPRPSSRAPRRTSPRRATRTRRASSCAAASKRRPSCGPPTARCYSTPGWRRSRSQPSSRRSRKTTSRSCPPPSTVRRRRPRTAMRTARRASTMIASPRCPPTRSTMRSRAGCSVRWHGAARG